MSLDPYMVYIRIGIYALLALLCFGGGWQINGWRLGSELAHVKQEYAQAAQQATTATLHAQQTLDAKSASVTATITAIDHSATLRITKVQDENKQLRTLVDTGSVRLRYAGACPVQGAGSVSGTVTSTSVGVSPGPELDAAAGRSYLALREGIGTITEQLNACQGILKAERQ